MFKWKSNSKVISLQINEDACTGCGSCVVRCKRNVFSLMYDKKRYIAVITTPEVCRGCSHCLKACKSNAIEIIKQ